MSDQPVRVHFVCLGNICRSPLAEGVLRHLAAQRGIGDRLAVSSSGTGAWHVGEPANRHSVAVAERHGVDLRRHVARQLERRDLDRQDWVLAMDRSNLRHIERWSRPDQRARTGLLLEFAPRLGLEDVPDPYYGGPEGFQQVYDLVEEACAGLLDRLFGPAR